MLPNSDMAEYELFVAEKMNSGPWIKHSLNVGVAARNIAEQIQGMDAEKAYILGVLHDIGRRVGVVTIPVHIYEGYKFAMDKGWDEVAKICMTHSYPLKEKEFNYESNNEIDRAIKKYILSCLYDDYDMLIQLCDSLATDYGFCILEKRLVDVTRRYGVWENMIDRWNATFDIKDYFEKQMSCSIYDVLPDIGKTTLLSPPPWKPPVK
ncbi:MAG: HDOD domain-containing protein [Lachnospiraceae bacterium]|nr:HDOD domain-containing protein [Lachnospiraceae bacterium]